MILLTSASAAQAGDECPAFLVFHASELAKTDEAAANQYASCASVPWLPVLDVAEAKLAECANNLPAQQSEGLREAILWVDHIANSLGGCETRLEIRREQ
jgi:hypothetical protein